MKTGGGPGPIQTVFCSVRQNYIVTSQQTTNVSSSGQLIIKMVGVFQA